MTSGRASLARRLRGAARAGTSPARDRLVGWGAVVIGLALAVVLQARGPVGVPLYDGVVTVEPYRYLHPVGDEVGDPSSATKTVPTPGGQSPVFVVLTEESPPQAQLVVGQDAFDVPANGGDITATITPVDATVQPADGAIAGNVYRISVTAANGQELTPKSCADNTCRTLVLRAPPDVLNAKIVHLVNGAWVDTDTGHAGFASMFQVNVDSLGDFAVIPTAAPAGGIDPLVFGAIALILFVVIVAGLFWYRRRPPQVPVAQLGGAGRARTPSKRKGPRRPPSGRSDS